MALRADSWKIPPRRQFLYTSHDGRTATGEATAPCQRPPSSAGERQMTLAPRASESYRLSKTAHPRRQLQRRYATSDDNAVYYARRVVLTGCRPSASCKSTSRTARPAVDAHAARQGSNVLLAPVVWAVVASCVSALSLCPSSWTYYYDSSGVEGHDSCVWQSSTTALWAQAFAL